MSLTVNITHIGTATAILRINGVSFITDPFFSPSGTSFPITPDLSLQVSDDPALRLDQLPVIDAVLLSHEDHPDNLDELGRRLLDGRKTFTTVAGASKLQPRPVKGLKPWEKVEVTIAGERLTIVGTPTKHVDGGECTGFVVTGDFGTTDGLPNAIYFSGDTVYIPELAKIAKEYHIRVAVLNLGDAHVWKNMNPAEPMYQVTMDGVQASRLFRELQADILIPLHYASWPHFQQGREALQKVFQAEGLSEKVNWLRAGSETKVL